MIHRLTDEEIVRALQPGSIVEFQRKLFPNAPEAAERLRQQAEANRPLDRGDLAASGLAYRFTLARPPRGVHRWLCRLGLHAWVLESVYNAGTHGRYHSRCVVCRKWSTR